MNERRRADMRGICALLWRSMLLLPLALGAFLLLLLALMAVTAPLVIGIIFLSIGIWSWGLATLAVEALMLWAWKRYDGNRWFRGSWSPF